MSEKYTLEVKNLTVKYGDKIVLEDINLKVKEGEIVAIVGPNGGGKTTFIKAVLGFIKIYRGEIKLLGLPPKKAIKTGKVGYLPQKSSVPKDFPLTVLDVVLFGLINSKLPKKEKIKKALEYLEYVGMADFKDAIYTDLSGGQQQRVSIARVLVAEPKIIFLDEPSTGVDVVAQERFYKFLADFKKKNNMSVVMVSHDIGVIWKFVDKVAGLNKKLHFYGKPEDLLKDNIIQNIYGCDIQLVIHSPECASCEHFHLFD
jgi:zinc transport system ATP-binding protein